MLDGGSCLGGQTHIVAGIGAGVGSREGSGCGAEGPIDIGEEGNVADSDLMFRPAVELAEMVRSGEVSASELVQISLERIEELNPSLNAFVEIDREGALETAAKIGSGDERPFAGVPVAIKNNRPVKGMKLTYGCSLMADHVSDYDHNVTRRLRDAGFVIVGTTTLPEYGILPDLRGSSVRSDA